MEENNNTIKSILSRLKPWEIMVLKMYSTGESVSNIVEECGVTVGKVNGLIEKEDSKKLIEVMKQGLSNNEYRIGLIDTTTERLLLNFLSKEKIDELKPSDIINSIKRLYDIRLSDESSKQDDSDVTSRMKKMKERKILEEAKNKVIDINKRAKNG